MTFHHSERGAAFLYVMLIFVTASVIIGGMLSTGYREVSRTEQFLNEMQAIQYALGAELYARQRLLDVGINPEMAANGGMWNGSQSPFVIAGGTVGMEIEDLHGRFNINSLLASNDLAAPHFKILCTELGISEKSAELALTQINALKPPPPVPGVAPVAPAWIMDTSELAEHILSVDDYLKLAPYITALPTDAFTININTASDTVLLAYIEKPEQLDTIHALIKTHGAINGDELTQFQNHDNSLMLDSNAYYLHVTVTMDGQPLVRLNSVLMRVTDPNRVAAIARAWE